MQYGVYGFNELPLVISFTNSQFGIVKVRNPSLEIPRWGAGPSPTPIDALECPQVKRASHHPFRR